MAAITKLINLYFSDRLREIDYFREHPAEVQERQFRYLLANGAKTEFGRDLGMKGIATQQQFRDRIPIDDYETISEFIDRTRRQILRNDGFEKQIHPRYPGRNAQIPHAGTERHHGALLPSLPQNQRSEREDADAGRFQTHRT